MAQEGVRGERKRSHGALKCSHGCHPFCCDSELVREKFFGVFEKEEDYAGKDREGLGMKEQRKKGKKMCCERTRRKVVVCECS